MATDWEQWVDRLRPVPTGEVLLGLSGGADSMALFHMLLFLRDRGGVTFSAVHVNHGLRGAASDGDEDFVREICRTAGVPLYVYKPDLRGRRDENAAREARYACCRTCAEETGIHTLTLAHHRDDQAETFLMRLMRGAGPEGLSCMRAQEEREGLRILRPMLEIGGAELRKALRERSLPWREDETNGGDEYLRNRVRHQFIPAMEAECPGVAGRLARAAELIALEHDATKEAARQAVARYSGEDWFAAVPLAELPEAVRREALRSWWEIHQPKLSERNLNSRQTEAISRLVMAKAGSSANLPGGIIARRGKQAIHLTGNGRKEAFDEIPWNGEAITLAGITLSAGSSQGNPGDGKRWQEVPRGFPDGCVVRTRRPGDRIRPFGMRESRSVQDYLTDRGVDGPWRDRIPLLCRGKEVLLAAGVGAGAVPAWEPEDEHIRLAWQGPMPWIGIWTERKTET